MSEVPVSEFMTRGVETVQGSDSVREVAERLRGGRFSSLIVCDRDKPVGLIGGREMTQLCQELLDGRTPTTAADVMQELPGRLREDAPISEAVELLTLTQARRIVIVDADGVLAGVVTQTDTMRAQAREIEAQRDELEQRVAERVQELADVNVQLEELSRLDPLLKIGNRRAMREELSRLEAYSRRYESGFGIALCDIDYFKKYNDHYGHPEADKILKQVAETIKQTVRAVDGVYRYGGEEILITFPETNLKGVETAAEHVRQAIEALEIAHVGSDSGILTMSIGVAAHETGDPDAQALISEADAALYGAKSAGRNTVRVAAG